MGGEGIEKALCVHSRGGAREGGGQSFCILQGGRSFSIGRGIRVQDQEVQETGQEGCKYMSYYTLYIGQGGTRSYWTGG